MGLYAGDFALPATAPDHVCRYLNPCLAVRIRTAKVDCAHWRRPDTPL